jgi:Sulfite exporter TauE/SafE
MPIHYLWLLPLGVVIGAFGTLIGAGGGFILVPVLLVIYPEEKTELITSISLAVVFFNALSGSAAYARMKRIDYKSGGIFAVATIPGAILGAVATAYLRRGVFDLMFGILMIVAGIYLWVSHTEEPSMTSRHHAHVASKPHGLFWTERDLVDADGVRWFHSRADTGSFVKLSGPHCNCHFAFRAGHHGAHRNSSARRSGGICPRCQAHDSTEHRCCRGCSVWRDVIEPGRRQSDYSRTRRCVGFRWPAAHSRSTPIAAATIK